MGYEEGWGNIGEVTSHLSVGKDSTYRWIDTKGFPAKRVGRLLRFDSRRWISRSNVGEEVIRNQAPQSIPEGQMKPSLARSTLQ